MNEVFSSKPDVKVENKPLREYLQKITEIKAVSTIYAVKDEDKMIITTVVDGNSGEAWDQISDIEEKEAEALGDDMILTAVDRYWVESQICPIPSNAQVLFQRTE